MGNRRISLRHYVAIKIIHVEHVAGFGHGLAANLWHREARGLRYRRAPISSLSELGICADIAGYRVVSLEPEPAVHLGLRALQECAVCRLCRDWDRDLRCR